MCCLVCTVCVFFHGNVNLTYMRGWWSLLQLLNAIFQWMYMCTVTLYYVYATHLLTSSVVQLHWSCNSYFIIRSVTSPEHGNTTVDRLTFCAKNFIGLVCHSRSSSRSAPWCSVASSLVPVQQVHVRPLCLLCSWSDDLELPHRQFAQSIVVHWQFPSPAQNIFVY